MARRVATVLQGVCVACGSCIAVCPKQAITIYKGMFALVDPARCVGCGRCASVCPAGVIEMKAEGER